MRVRRTAKSSAPEVSRPRVFRQWGLGSEPPQFGDLSVTEAQLYLASGADIEAIFLDTEGISFDGRQSPGFWTQTDPVYDPHHLVAKGDALRRPYIGVQVAIPAPWVEVTVRYSKQTAEVLDKLGRRSYRALQKQVRNHRERRQDPVTPDTTSYGCGFHPGVTPDHHRVDDNWIDLARVLTDGVLHVLGTWPVAVCGYLVDAEPERLHTARTYPAGRHLETEQLWRYCPRCWPIVKRMLLAQARDAMLNDSPSQPESQAPKVVARQASQDGVHIGSYAPGDDIPAPGNSGYARRTLSFSTPEKVTVTGFAVSDANAADDDDEIEEDLIPDRCSVCYRPYGVAGVTCTYNTASGGWTCNNSIDSLPSEVWGVQYRRVVTRDNLAHISLDGDPSLPLACGSGAVWVLLFPANSPMLLKPFLSIKQCPDCDTWLAKQQPDPRPGLVSVVHRFMPSLGSVGDGETELYRVTGHSSIAMTAPPVVTRAAEEEPLSPESESEEQSIPSMLLMEPKTYLPDVLRDAGLAPSRAWARAAINDDGVSIAGWPSIVHRHTFQSKDLDGKTVLVDGVPSLRLTTQVSVPTRSEQTDS